MIKHWLTRRRKRAFTRLAVLLMSAGISACGPTQTAPDQVLVRGQGFEITVQEYDQILKRSPLVTREAITPMRQALMEGLISEKLLSEEAVKAGLDKQAATAQAIAASKRSVLAQAYVDKLSASAFRPSDSDIQRYYAGHKEQFEQRRRFVVNEYVVRSDLPDVRRYVSVLDKQGMVELGNVLRSAMPAIMPVTLVRFSDEIPDTGNTLRNMRAGDAIVYQTPGQLHLGQVQAIESDPVTLEIARSRIEAGIVAQRRNELVKVTVDRLRKARHVEVLQTSLASSIDQNRHGEMLK